MKKNFCYEYPRPALTVDAVVFGYNARSERVEVLLIERKNEPFRGMFAFPGGFIEINENLDEAVARELAEETELLGVPLIQMQTFGHPKRDPRGRVITVAYFSLINNTHARVEGSDDAARAQWFDLFTLPQLAFDHKQILWNAVKFAIYNMHLETDRLYDHAFSKFAGIIDHIGREKLLTILRSYANTAII